MRCEVVERVLEFVRIRCIAIAETYIVWRDHMELVSQLGNQVTKHVRRAWEAVQEHDGWRIPGTGLATEKLSPAYGGVVVNCHVSVLSLLRLFRARTATSSAVDQADLLMQLRVHVGDQSAPNL